MDTITNFKSPLQKWIVISIVFMLSVSPIAHSQIVIQSIEDRTLGNQQSEVRYDLNGNVCAEIRIDNSTEVRFSGNIIGDINHIPGYISSFCSVGTKQIEISSPNHGICLVKFKEYGIAELLAGHIYVISAKAIVKAQSRLEDAKLLFDAGLPGVVIEMYENETDITGDEYMLLAESVLAVENEKKTQDYKNYTQDYSLYNQFLMLASKHGNPEAQNRIAYKYRYGFDGFEEDVDKALEFYSKSASSGYAYSLIEIVEMYVYKDNNIEDYDKAIYWIDFALNKCPNLEKSDRADIIALKGYVSELKGDIKGAAKLYTCAIENGPNDFLAQYRLGRMYASGNGVKKDLSKAKELLEAGSWYDSEAQEYYNNFISE